MTTAAHEQPAAPPLRLRGQEGAFPIGAALGGAMAAGAIVVSTLGLDRLPMTLCGFKLITGHPCFTCGTTRALARLAHLDLQGALLVNPLVTVGAFVLVAWALADLVLLTRRRALRLDLTARSRACAGAAAGTALVANWIYLLLARI